MNEETKKSKLEAMLNSPNENEVAVAKKMLAKLNGEVIKEEPKKEVMTKPLEEINFCGLSYSDLELLNAYCDLERYTKIRLKLESIGRELLDDNEYFFWFKFRNRFFGIGFQNARALLCEYIDSSCNEKLKETEFVYFEKYVRKIRRPRTPRKTNYKEFR